MDVRLIQVRAPRSVIPAEQQAVLPSRKRTGGTRADNRRCHAAARLSNQVLNAFTLRLLVPLDVVGPLQSKGELAERRLGKTITRVDIDA